MNNVINTLATDLLTAIKGNSTTCGCWVRPSRMHKEGNAWVESMSTGWTDIQTSLLKIGVIRFIDNDNRRICLDDYRPSHGWEVIKNESDCTRDDFTLIEYTSEDKSTANFYAFRIEL